MADVKLLAAGSISTVAAPVIEPCHDVVGMVVTHLADTVCQTQSHAAVIRPVTRRLTMHTAAHHTGDRIAPQIFSCSAFSGHSQSVRYDKAVQAVSDF